MSIDDRVSVEAVLDEEEDRDAEAAERKAAEAAERKAAERKAETSAPVPVNAALDSGTPQNHPADLAEVPDGPCTPHNHPPTGA